jgi:hypothetical protein
LGGVIGVHSMRTPGLGWLGRSLFPGYGGHSVGSVQRGCVFNGLQGKLGGMKKMKYCRTRNIVMLSGLESQAPSSPMTSYDSSQKILGVGQKRGGRGKERRQGQGGLSPLRTEEGQQQEGGSRGAWQPFSWWPQEAPADLAAALAVCSWRWHSVFPGNLELQTPGALSDSPCS